MSGPAWRCQFARELAASAARLLHRGDELVHRAAEYLRALQKDDAGQRLCAKFATIDAAFQLQEQEAVVEKLKILILADCAPSVIAERLRLDGNVIELWEKLFFDVRPCLGALDWISSNVIEAETLRGNRRLAARLKAAIAGGQKFAIAILDADDKIPVEEGERLFRRKLLLDLKLDEAHSFPLANGADALRIIKLSVELHHDEKRLELDTARFQYQCEEAAKAHKLAHEQLELSRRRLELRIAERDQRLQRRPERRAAASAPLHNRAQELSAIAQEKRDARARAAASPLAALRWRQTTSHKHDVNDPPFVELPAIALRLSPGDYGDGAVRDEQNAELVETLAVAGAA